MYNLKNLSFLELIEIQEKVNKELEERRLNKSSITDRRIRGQFYKDWSKNNILFWDRCKFLERIYSSTYAICDFTLENYKIVSSSKSGNQIKLNGSRINIEDPILYEKMASEIFDIIRKYYEKSHGCKMTELTESEEKIFGRSADWEED